MKPMVRIRRFRMGEEAALFGVFYSAVHRVARQDYTDQQVNAWAPSDLDQALWASHIRGLNPFVAEMEGGPVGYADLQPGGEIDHFFVSGFRPREGIGHRLMVRIDQQAEALGLRELHAEVSRTAQPFFAKYGFSVIEHNVRTVRGVALCNALMRKRL